MNVGYGRKYCCMPEASAIFVGDLDCHARLHLATIGQPTNIRTTHAEQQAPCLVMLFPVVWVPSASIYKIVNILADLVCFRMRL